MSQTTKIGIIGDVHGKMDKYTKLIQSVDYSIQVGDLGFAPEYRQLKASEIDRDKHVFIAGNHDDYDYLGRHPGFSLGSFGVKDLGGFEFFFIRGAQSTDRRGRLQGVSWWPEEQLSAGQMGRCYDEYREKKPKVVISHDCPMAVYFKVLRDKDKEYGSPTSKFLQILWETHRPEMWFFGHHHVNMDWQFRGTLFRCVAPLDMRTLIIK